MSIAGRLTNVKRISIHHCQAITDAGIKESSREKNVLFQYTFMVCIEQWKKALAAKFDGLTHLQMARCNQITDASIEESDYLVRNTQTMTNNDALWPG